MTGTDFTGLKVTVTFAPGSTNGTLECLPMLVLIDDDALEGDQSFSLTLNTLDSSVMIEGNVTTITITDNDGAAIYIIIYFGMQ